MAMPVDLAGAYTMFPRVDIETVKNAGLRPQEFTLLLRDNATGRIVRVDLIDLKEMLGGINDNPAR